MGFGFFIPFGAKFSVGDVLISIGRGVCFALEVLPEFWCQGLVVGQGWISFV